MEQAMPEREQPQRQRAFSALLQRHGGIVAKVAATYAWQPDDRAELEQEIATQAWAAFPRYDDQRPFATWLYRIALNVAISHVRRLSYRRRHETDSPTAPEPVAPASEPDERLTFLAEFIQQLDPLGRALLLLYLEQHSYRDISEVLGISETNVATKISRLKQQVRAASAARDRQEIDHGT